eukprot:TRINITY_DN9033_c0_g1_i1.p1 TRINITY_DN9033_c0_g1~~TRINITY_DN9033_c0_g1_i1.p1  ORF type:complete len:281 (+),score=95.45 TRINITY_DN9033_c0_g1_i1:84-926(+)
MADAKESHPAPAPVVSYDDTYVSGVKIYNTGIKEDPVKGEKRGKGVQHLNSSYWLHDLAVFIAKSLPTMKEFLRIAYQLAQRKPGADFNYLLNQGNVIFMRAENEALRTVTSRENFLMASWLAMAAAEVDGYNYAKYTAQERAEMRERFYQTYFAEEVEPVPEISSSSLGAYSAPLARVDLIPPVALERLGIHNELCAIKWADPTVWKREGFLLSKRIDSLKRHFDSAHLHDFTEDHIAHLTWNFMAVYHVAVVFPHLNDLTNYEEMRVANEQKVASGHE